MVEPVFGTNSMNKALCGCGAIADLDTDVVRRKQDLGKRVECSRCRNRRIAEEREALERYYHGLDEAEQDESSVRPALPKRFHHRPGSRQ
ncbi:MAG: hypothetical protein SA339_05895 [Methanomassiliicoccus sp.]|nr:hypothetical protein [Methanomassiliicoccus sp.]